MCLSSLTVILCLLLKQQMLTVWTCSFLKSKLPNSVTLHAFSWRSRFFFFFKVSLPSDSSQVCVWWQSSATKVQTVKNKRKITKITPFRLCALQYYVWWTTEEPWFCNSFNQSSEIPQGTKVINLPNPFYISAHSYYYFNNSPFPRLPQHS